jgi:hypothetical protein
MEIRLRHLQQGWPLLVAAHSALEVVIVRAGWGLDLGKFDQKNYRAMGQVRVNLIRIRSGFGSNIVGFRVNSSRVGSGFGLLVAQVISGFGHSGPSRVSYHLISGNLGFRVILGQGISSRVGFRVVKT